MNVCGPSGKNSSVGHKLDPNCRKAEKVFCQTIRGLCDERCNTRRTIKNQTVSYSAMRWTYLADEESILMIFWTQSPSGTGRAFGRGKYHRCDVTEVFEDVKTQKTRRTAGCDGVRPELFKAFNSVGILWITRSCQVTCRSGRRVPKDWQTGLIIPIHKKGDRKECTNYLGFSPLSIPGKVCGKYLEKWCRTR